MGDLESLSVRGSIDNVSRRDLRWAPEIARAPRPRCPAEHRAALRRGKVAALRLGAGILGIPGPVCCSPFVAIPIYGGCAYLAPPR